MAEGYSCSLRQPEENIGGWRTVFRISGKVLAVGVYPDVGLADARELRAGARKLLAKGINPNIQLRIDKIASKIASARTFGAVADEWLGKIQRMALPKSH